MSEMTKISAVFSVKKSLVVHTENWMDSVFELISFRIIPDDDELKESHPQFKQLLKAKKDATLEIDRFRNEHG